MKDKKKFFFTKEDNVIASIDRVQMLKIVGGQQFEDSTYKCATCQYTESTYVRR